MRRHLTTLLLWGLGLASLALLLVRGVPWVWPKLFPGTPAAAEAPPDEAPPSPEYVAEVLSRFLAGWGQHLPPGDAVLELPPGRAPRELEDGLRREPRLGGLQIHVTAVDDLHFALRVFAGPRLLLHRRVRPWLPERPIVPSGNRPRLGAVVVLGDDDELLPRLGAWKAPLGLAMRPFAPHAARAARQASWDGKGVVALMDPDEDLIEQSRALREAGGVLLLEPLPEGLDPTAWLAALASSRQFLLDGVGDEALRRAAAAAGVDCQPLAGRLGEPDGRRVAWALTQRRGAGVVVVDATEGGLTELEAFVEASRDVGFALVLPAEALSGSGGPAAP
jgi:hypothetical protein